LTYDSEFLTKIFLKPNSGGDIVHKFLIMGLALTTLFWGTVVSAEEAKVDPGPAKFKQETSITEITATVKSVDQANRMVTLEGPQGNLLTTKVDDDVENFKKVKVGDKVDIQLYESLALSVKKNEVKKDIMKKTTVTTMNATTSKKKPIKVETEQVHQIVDITKVNKDKGTVTIIGVKGMPVDVKVEDPKNLEGLKKGDQVEITYTESVAFEVRKK